MKAMGLQFYRFSISWPRLMPDGTAASLSADGLRYYNNLIDELIANDISPMVTLYHWDLPQALQDHGGWANETIINNFNDYARACYENFGDRVKLWITFNEPWIVSLLGYGSGAFAPGIAEPAMLVYKVTHNIILSHAHAYTPIKMTSNPHRMDRLESPSIVTSLSRPTATFQLISRRQMMYFNSTSAGLHIPSTSTETIPRS